VSSVIDKHRKDWAHQYPDKFILIDLRTETVTKADENDWPIVLWLENQPLDARGGYLQLHTSTLTWAE
jgi:hypothetical protein